MSTRLRAARWPYAVSAFLASGYAWGLWRDEGANSWAAVYAAIAVISVIQFFWATVAGWLLVMAAFLLSGGFVLVLLADGGAGPLEWMLVPWFAIGPAVVVWPGRPKRIQQVTLEPGGARL